MSWIRLAAAFRRYIMKFPFRPVFILMAVIVAAFLVVAIACGGDEEEEEAPKVTPTVAAEETPEEAETPAGEAGEPSSIPTYPGATNVFTTTFSGSETFPIPLTGDGAIGPEEFDNVEYSVYETNDSPQKVIDFYKKEFKGWEEEESFSMEQLGQNGEVIVWSKDDREVAAWMAAFETEGTTSVVIAIGTGE
jgi:hypothetical protein